MAAMRRIAGWLGLLLCCGVPAQPAPPPVEPGSALFAVEVRTGPNWDPAKPPAAQAGFQDHSAHLKRLRGEGRIVFGARYGDVGLLVFSATGQDEVRALMQADPSMAAGTFRFSVHPFNVFYPGTLPPPKDP